MTCMLTVNNLFLFFKRPHYVVTKNKFSFSYYIKKRAPVSLSAESVFELIHVD